LIFEGFVRLLTMQFALTRAKLRCHAFIAEQFIEGIRPGGALAAQKGDAALRLKPVGRPLKTARQNPEPDFNLKA
jgi:hypothetical protein